MSRNDLGLSASFVRIGRSTGVPRAALAPMGPGVPAGPVVPTFYLLEDGVSFYLMEDGTSKYLRE